MPSGLTQRGEWFNVGNLRFRRVSFGELRNDARVSKEVELVKIPGFEVEAAPGKKPENFLEEAETLWFCLRILASFCHRQLFHRLRTADFQTDQVSISWIPQALEPRTPREPFSEGPVRGPMEGFFAAGARRLLRLGKHQQALHAAVFGYSSSYSMTLLEGRLTACVEALERMVGVFEEVNSLTRAIVPAKEWRRISAQLRATATGVGLSASQMKSVHQNLANPPNMSLEDRLNRMTSSLKIPSSSDDSGLVSVSLMIKIRNHIVHGRMIENYNDLNAEILRARTLFEVLFLNLVGCRASHGSGYARWSIRAFDAKENMKVSR